MQSVPGYNAATRLGINFGDQEEVFDPVIILEVHPGGDVRAERALFLASASFGNYYLLIVCLAPELIRPWSTLAACANRPAAMKCSPNSLVPTELLESIFLYLDMRTLLASAQRVSKPWHSVINTSGPIQRVLFLAASVPGKSAGAAVPKRNNRGRGKAPAQVGGCPRLNPHATAFLRGWPAHVEHTPWQMPRYILDLGAIHDAAADISKRNDIASWRRMLVQQDPPVRRVGMYCCEPDIKARTITLTTKLYDVTASPGGGCAAAGGLTIGAISDMCTRLHGSEQYEGYQVSLRPRWAFKCFTACFHSWGSEGDGCYEFDIEDEVALSLGVVDEFETLKHELVEAADLVLEVAYFGDESCSDAVYEKPPRYKKRFPAAGEVEPAFDSEAEA
ncbi:hypothetical protein Micbo1qcDRAFT_179496 [Microdochium bolleyi]|uniref:F-box domain-containing protein n=1 Tax=Microdochium bolleyi TaxID=196109 RepID=A0A136IPL4_9PEZI|nr:hypothetical protein Micbo1qcDRAFT_179496 [Microdochium bolleyi]